MATWPSAGLAQHALRRHPERRRLSRRAALPRHRAQIDNAADAEAYLARLEAYAGAARQRDRRGCIMAPHKGVIAARLPDRQGARRSCGRPRRAGAEAAGWSNRSRAGPARRIPRRLGRRARAIARSEVAPALDRQIAELERAARARDERGRHVELPQGEDYYRWALKAATTTRMRPTRSTSMGLDELASFTARDGHDPARGSAHRGTRRRAHDRRWARTRATLFPNSDEGPRRDHGLHRASAPTIIRAGCRRRSTRWSRGNVEVRRLPPERKPGAPGAYGGAGSIDGTIPGKFWINLRRHRPHSRATTCRPHLSRGDSRPRLAGRICATSCR